MTFGFASQGTITKRTDRKVRGEFPSTVVVTLVIVNEISEAQGGPVTEYTGEASADCVLEASLLKAGKRDNVKLRCNLGENLSAFAPALTPALLENVHNAYGAGKRARVYTNRGRLKIPHTGDPAAGGVPVSCSLDGD